MFPSYRCFSDLIRNPKICLKLSTGDHKSTNHLFSNVVSHFRIKFEFLHISTMYAFLNREHVNIRKESKKWNHQSKVKLINQIYKYLTYLTHNFYIIATDTIVICYYTYLRIAQIFIYT